MELRLYCFAVFAVLVVIPAKGQQLSVRTAEGKAVGKAHVWLTPAGGRKQRLELFTDSSGNATLPATGYPYALTVSNDAFGVYKDSLKAYADKLITLKARERTLGEVVVTAQYVPGKKENAVQKIEVIDRKTIDAMAAQNLRDALSNQLDIRLSYDAIFGTSINLQGSKMYGADAKILIDGVPVTGKQNGAVDLSQVNLANIDRIEIVKGPMSVSYGTDAVAGTVNLITRKCLKNSWEAGATAYYESIGTYNVTARAGFNGRHHSLVLDGMRNFFGGWNPGAGPSLLDFKAELADSNRVQLWKPREQYNGCLQYTYKYKKLSANYKSSYFQELITSRGAPMAPYQEMAFDNYFHTYRIDNAVFVNGEIASHKNVSFLAAYNDYRRVKNIAAKDLTTLNETLSAEAQDTSWYGEANSRGIFNTSNGDVKVNYELGYDINLQYANSTQILDRKKSIQNYAAFASVEYRTLKELTIKPAARVAHNSVYSAPVVPSLNIMYKPGGGWAFRASYAKGFRQPDLKELYFDFVDINHNIHGNEDLKAEHSHNFMSSATYTRKYEKVVVTADASAFYNEVANLITLASVPSGAVNEYTYVNIGDYRIKGAQASVNMATGAVNATVGGSMTGTYNPLSETSAIPAFSYSPEVRGNVIYTAKKYGFSVAAFYKYTGRFTTFIAGNQGDAQQSRMAGYNTADVTVSKGFAKKRFNVSAGCKNLFNVQNVAGTTGGGAHASVANTVAIGTGRYYFFKTEIQLSK